MRYFSLFSVLWILSFHLYGAEDNQHPKFTFENLPDDVQSSIFKIVIEENPNELVKLLQVSRKVNSNTMLALEDETLRLSEIPFSFLLEFPGYKKRIHYLLENHPNPISMLSKTLETNHTRWVAFAKQAGLNNQDPDHLLEILKLEDMLLSNLLNEKEKDLEIRNAPDEWIRHALASLLSFHAVKILASNVARTASGNVARTAAWTDASTAAWTVASNISGNVFMILAGNAARTAAKNVVKNLCEYLEVGYVACRVVETVAWTTLLDPKNKVFEKSYDAAYQRLDRENEIDTNGWFESQETFKAKMHQYFGEGNKNLDEHSKKFLYPLVTQLNRIANEKIFSQSVSATGS